MIDSHGAIGPGTDVLFPDRWLIRRTATTSQEI